ncbi:MAG: hypothetical protein ACOYKE_07945 [Ferruginibacter sp.]
MKKIMMFSALILMASISFGQKKIVPVKLKKVLEFQMPEGDGTRGAGVVYHPIFKKYYASFAGNSQYPMAIFDLKGKRISEDGLATDFDTRGMWYNPIKKTVEANGYADNGYTSYVLDKKGIPQSNEVFLTGSNQPTEQSVATFNAKEKVLYFLSNRKVLEYNYTDGIPTEKYFPINFAAEDIEGIEDDSNPEKYNSTTVIYTGIVGKEFALLNVYDSKIELYNKKTGNKSGELTFPEEGTPILESMFNFSYANGIFWVFSIDERKWVGFK